MKEGRTDMDPRVPLRQFPSTSAYFLKELAREAFKLSKVAGDADAAAGDVEGEAAPLTGGSPRRLPGCCSGRELHVRLWHTQTKNAALKNTIPLSRPL